MVLHLLPRRHKIFIKENRIVARVCAATHAELHCPAESASLRTDVNKILTRFAQMPVTGLRRSQLLALGAIVVYQLVLFYQHEHHLPPGKGIKPWLRAA